MPLMRSSLAIMLVAGVVACGPSEIEPSVEADEESAEEWAGEPTTGAPVQSSTRRSVGPAPRPPLEVRQGQYYRLLAPPGWRLTENLNAIEITSPDGLTGSSFSLALGMFGTATPRTHLQMVYNSLGLPDARIVSWQDLPKRPAFMNFEWQVGHAELAMTYRGTPSRGAATVGVIQGAGQYVAVILAGQAPAPQWLDVRGYLLRMAHSVTVTDPFSIARAPSMALPRNIPHDYIYGDYNASWLERQISQDRISQARREGTMGFELYESPTTGQQYEMPLELYDPTRGGYRDPRDPSQLLVRPPNLR